jgi:lambda repressor-like predicted transcriptional regulator
MSDPFTMPIQNHRYDKDYSPDLDGPFVWVPTEADRRQAQSNHGQSLERLAQRGGMSWCEMAAIVLNKPWRKFEQPYAKAICRDVLVMRDRIAQAEVDTTTPR